MTQGPYRPGKNRVSASRLNETDSLARLRFHVGPGLRWESTVTGQRLSLVPEGPNVRPVATGARFGFIMHVTSTPMLLVKFLKHEVTTVDQRQVGEWTTDGEPRAAWLFPNAQGSDVATLARGDFDSTTPVVRLDKIADVWYVTWVPRWTIRDLPSTAGRVRCP